MILTNGKIRKRVEGYFKKFYDNPDYGEIWKKYVEDTITFQNLESTICKMLNISLSQEESEALQQVIMKQLLEELGVIQQI